MRKHQPKSSIHKFIWEHTLAFILIGLLITVAASNIAGKEPPNGSAKQLIFDLLAIIGWIIIIGGIAVAAKKKLSKD